MSCSFCSLQQYLTDWSWPYIILCLSGLSNWSQHSVFQHLHGYLDSLIKILKIISISQFIMNCLCMVKPDGLQWLVAVSWVFHTIAYTLPVFLYFSNACSWTSTQAGGCRLATWPVLCSTAVLTSHLRQGSQPKVCSRVFNILWLGPLYIHSHLHATILVSILVEGITVCCTCAY